MKRTVRLTESQLVSMIQKVVNEQSLEGKNLAFCYGKTWKDIGNKMVKDEKSFKIQNFTFKGFIENIPSQPAEFTDGKRTLTINPNGTWTLSKPVEGMRGLNQGVMDGKWKCLLIPGSGMDGYTIQLDKKIGITESDLVRSVKKVIEEQKNIWTYEGDPCVNVRQKLSSMGYKQYFGDNESNDGQQKDVTKFKYKGDFGDMENDLNVIVYITKGSTPRVEVKHEKTELLKIIEKIAKSKGIKMEAANRGLTSHNLKFKDCNSLLQFVKELDQYI